MESKSKVKLKLKINAQHLLRTARLADVPKKPPSARDYCLDSNSRLRVAILILMIQLYVPLPDE